MVQWLCKCDCGKEVIVQGKCLRGGKTSSCGCYKIDKLKERLIKHGMSYSSLYNVYQKMKSRCYNTQDKRYKNYGGRGITICNEWLGEDGFINFQKWAIKSGYRDDLTIDRIDVDGIYEPGNCRWTDMLTQENNKTNNHLITYKDKTMTLSMWSKELGIKYKTLANRIIMRDWSIEKAFTQPVDSKKGSKKHD